MSNYRDRIINHQDGLRIAQALESIATKTTNENAIRYGVRIDKNDSNPDTRIKYILDADGMKPARMNFDTGKFDYGDWQDAWFVKQNYPAMVKSDKTIDYMLDPLDHSKKINGEKSDIENEDYDGNAMAVFDGSISGKIWLHHSQMANYEYVIISNVKYDDTYHDDAYVDADGTHSDKLFYPMYNGSKSNGKLRSLSGKAPQVNTNTSEEVAQAEANGDGWSIRSWSKMNLFNALLTIISKRDNCQTAFGRGYVDWPWSGEDGCHPNITGSLNKEGQFYGETTGRKSVKCFFVEDWWGSRWERMLGYIQDHGVVKLKMTPPYNLTGEGYTAVFELPFEKEGYVKETKSGRFGRVPYNVGGSSTTYLCDYQYVNKSLLAVAFAGGSWGNGSSAGAWRIDLDCVAGYRSSGVGASLFG